MQEYIEGAIKVVDDPSTGIITLTYANPDPKFASDFLMRVHAVADGNLRVRARTRATQYIGYLSAQLQQITLAEHRAAVAAALSDQEKARMAASSTMAFAAEPVDVATASLRPTTPRPFVIVAVGVLGGFIIGLLAALLLPLVRRNAV
jgi:LPS O-antigen subunit length determinant protein (WzzB/FepE family)